jgi:hypothetical protein
MTFFHTPAQWIAVTSHRRQAITADNGLRVAQTSTLTPNHLLA